MSDQPLPWIPHLSREYLERLIQPDWYAFEWGSGGSTLWLAPRVQQLISVEHDPEWGAKTQVVLPNVEYQLIPPEHGEFGANKAMPQLYLAGPIGNVNFKRYACSIDGRGPFDLVLVDGRARASCLLHAVPEVRPGGWLVLDNAERDYYLQYTAHLVKDWERVWFTGHGPHIDWTWQCVFWRKPA